MHATIVKEYRFEAAHHLDHHQGKCARQHGHSYRLQIGVRGRVRGERPGEESASDAGMVLDFSEVSTIVKRMVVDVLDHQDINEVLPLLYPTAELLSSWMFVVLLRPLESAGVALSWVQLWETETSAARFERADWEQWANKERFE